MRPAAGGVLSAEEWDRRYKAVHHLFRDDPDETLTELVSPLRPGKAVDLGAGEGRNSLWLARGGWDVVAVDSSAVAMDRLTEAAAAESLVVEGVRADLLQYLDAMRNRGQSFDLVVLAFVHPAPEQRAELLSAAAGAVGACGYLFVVGHHLESLGKVGPPDPERLFTEEQLRQSVRDLEVLRLERRSGMSDVTEPGLDVVLWARRSPHSAAPSSARCSSGSD